MTGPYDVGAAFAAIEEELVASMMRNMERHRVEEASEGEQWAMWQAMQLRSLEEYKRENREKYGPRFAQLNGQISALIREANATGGMEQEIGILKALQDGSRGYSRATDAMQAEFFRLNERKLEALVRATVHDMEKAETAVLRMADDQYRRAIFNAQVYANTGSGTYEKAVDMATKDMLAAGLNCVEYKNGARHTLADYADMAIRTAAKRAYLQGEGVKRQEWGISTVIMNKRGNPCPKCLPFCGKILIDDVWSGGKRSDGPYPLMSSAIAAGLYHPRCKDSHTTYFEGISTPPDDKYSKKELKEIQQDVEREAKQQYAGRQAERFGRLARYSLDVENRERYHRKASEWEKQVEKFSDPAMIEPENIREVIDVHTVGKIDREIYKCITDDIVTDEVIITDNQIQHIKDRHPNDYERFAAYFGEIVGNPDYIIESKKPNTALVLKEIQKENEVFKTVLRLVTSRDNPEYKNSIITFMKIDEKEWARLLRNKKVLYKKE